MKRVIALVVVLVLIIVTFFVIILTPIGSNAILKPIANSYIKKNVAKPKIEIEKIDSSFGQIDINAKIENSIKFNAKGDISYFKKAFNLDYTTKAESIKIDNLNLNPNLNLHGKLQGNVDKFSINGSGKAFDSNVEYRAKVENSQAKAIVAKIQGANVSQIMALFKIAPVVDGVANIDIQMPSLDVKNPKGRANIELRDGLINAKILNRVYGVSLPKNEKIEANLVANIINSYIVAKGEIVTTIARVNIKKITSAPDFKISKGYLDINIPNLRKLEPFIHKKLNGKFKVDGAFFLNKSKKIFQANLKSKSFSGKTEVKYKSNKLNLILDNVDISKVLYTFNMPPYITKGHLSSKVDIPSLQKLNGSFSIDSNGVLNKKLFKVNLPSYKYSIKSKGALKNGMIYAKKSTLTTPFIKLFLDDTKYAILTNSLTTKFTADIDNLKPLKPIIQRDLNGKLLVKGKYKSFAGAKSVNGFTKSLGGTLHFDYSTNSFSSKFKNISIAKITHLVDLPNIVNKGFLTGEVKLNSLKPISGVATIHTNGLLDNSTVNRLYNLNLQTKVKYILKVKQATISKNIFSAQPTINSSLANISFKKFKYNIDEDSLNASYHLDIQNLNRIGKVIDQTLQGSLVVNGEISKRGEHLVLSGVSNKFNGTTNFTLNKDILTLNSAGVNIIDLLHMLKKPEDIDGIARLDLKYNTATKKGDFKVVINELKILNNKLINILKKFNFNISQEVFKVTNIDGTINNNIITFDLKTKSPKVEMSVNNGFIDTKNQTIKARVKIILNGNSYYIRVFGKTSNPNFTLEFNGAVRDKAIDMVKKKVFKNLNIDNSSMKELEKKAIKTVDKEIKKDAKKLIKGLFK